jgi:hypothetical protein
VPHLSAGEARDASVRPLDGTGVTTADDEVDSVLAEVDGHPYAIPPWGAGIRDETRMSSIAHLNPRVLDTVEPDVYRRVDMDFCDGRVEPLTPAGADLLLPTASWPYPPRHDRTQRKTSGGTADQVLGELATFAEEALTPFVDECGHVDVVRVEAFAVVLPQLLADLLADPR